MPLNAFGPCLVWSQVPFILIACVKRDEIQRENHHLYIKMHVILRIHTIYFYLLIQFLVCNYQQSDFSHHLSGA
jgi:hypothetical protein